MEREGKAKIVVKALNGSYSVQPQQTGGEVDTVPGRITRPATKPAIPEGHRGVSVLVKWADSPALAIKGQPIMTGGVLGAYPLPTFPENISQAAAPSVSPLWQLW